MSNSPVFNPNGFSSTPVKKSTTRLKGFHKPTPLDLDVGVLSDGEDTFSLLSPIYHDSFESGENSVSSSGQSSPKGRNTPLFSERCELPKTPSDQLFVSGVPLTITPTLSPWEQWLLSKTKGDQLKSEKKAEEERLLQEKKKQQQKEHEQKVAMINERIQKWLKMKREQEKQEQLLKQSKEQEALNAQMEKQRYIESKAQEKYKEWLQKKNQEKAEKQRKQREEAALKEEQEKERRTMAEKKFKEWLHQANAKNIAYAKSAYPIPHGKAYPSPSFYNPIPWKPIHMPPPETENKASVRKTHRGPKGQRSLSTVSRQQNSLAQSRRRR